MFFKDKAGLYSVAMGQDSLASGEGSINISFSNEANSHPMHLGLQRHACPTKGNLSHPNSIVFSSSQLQFNTGENSSNILFSSAIESSSTPPFSGSHNIVFNGKIQQRNLTIPSWEDKHCTLPMAMIHCWEVHDHFINV